MANKRNTNARDGNILFSGTTNEVTGYQSGSERDERPVSESEQNDSRSNWRTGLAAYLRNPAHIWVVGLIVLLSLGAFGAGLKYLEESAQKQRAAANASLPNNARNQNQGWMNSLNPFVEPPLPTATPQLSKEYIYAGSRMLAVEDANANAAPPADLAVWRPSTGYWFVLGGQGSQQTSFPWGASTDKPVPGDYDGDGKTDFSVYRPSTGFWYVNNSSNGYTFELPSYGAPDDTVAPADYDGDGRTDMAVFRPSSGFWYIKRSGDAGSTSQQFGISSDIPVSADYDGDGKADIAVWRESSAAYYILRSSDTVVQTVTFGQAGDKPVIGDYDGDGRADYAVRRGNDWIIKQSSNNVTLAPIPWYSGGDTAVQNDYDGDGKVDIAVWNPATGNWYIRQSSLGGQLRQVQWGASTDVPVPAFYRR